MIRLPSELTGQGGAQTPSGNSGGSIRLPSDLTGGNTPQPVKKPILPLAKNSAGFAQTYKGGQGYGPSNIEDTTGKPLLVYENPQAQQTQLLANRTATKFDPTVPQKIDPATLSNSDKRMASDTIRQSLGATAKQQLDHIMPLELGGANSDALGNVNLRLEPTTKGVNTATDPIENAITQKVLNGEISLVQGWQEMAKAKGITLQEQGGKLTSPQPNPPTLMQRLTAGAKAVAGDIGNYFFGPKPKPQQTPIPQQAPMIRLGQEFTGMPTPTIPTSVPSISEMVNKAVPAGTIMQKPELTPEQQAQKTQIEGMTPTQEWQATGKLAASIPQGIAQAALKFGVSAYQAPQTIISGGKIVPDAIPVPPMIQKILGENEISSYQRDTANDIQNGANPITAVGVNSAKALFDAWIVNDIAGAALKPALRSIANQLPENVLYKISEERIPVSDIMDVLRGTGEPSQKATDFVKSLADEERRPLAQLARESEKAGAPEIKIRKTGEPTLTGELLGVEKKPPQAVIETPSRALPGTQEVRPGPAVGLSTKEVRPVGRAENADLIAEAKKYKNAEEFVKKQTTSDSWTKAQKANPELWSTGILRKSQSPYGAKESIPADIHAAQAKWQNYGQSDEVPAETIYGKPDNYGYYSDKNGNSINDTKTGNLLKDSFDDSTGERIPAMISNEQLRNNLLDSFSTKEGQDYLGKVIRALPKNPDGTITAYRIGSIGEGAQSYTLSEGMAKTFSHQGTDIPISGTPGLPKGGYKDFGILPTNIVKINPVGIKAWNPYDAEILVEPKYVQTKSQLADIWNRANGKQSLPAEAEKIQETVPGMDEEALIKKTISKNDLMKIVERFYPKVADFYEDEGIQNAKDYVTKLDPRTIALELDSDYNTMTAIERLVGPTEEGINIEKIIEMMKKGELREDLGINKSFTPELSGISNAPVPEERKFYESPAQTIPENIKEIFDSAMQKMIGSAVEKEQILKDRKTIFHLWATNPDAAKILGVSPAELNKKMRSMAGFPLQGKKIQSEINLGVPEQFQWNGITNASYFEKSGVTGKDIDSIVNDIDGTRKSAFYGPDGKMLRHYIMDTFMAIDTRMRYDDLDFNIRTLEHALGQYDNSKILITIDTGFEDTVAHEIGHYLDYRFAREIGIGSSPLSDASIGWEYVQQKHGISEDHVAWAKQFKKFIDSIEMRSEIGTTAKRAEYLQKRTEIFARFISRFVAWTNKQAGIRSTENNFYADVFYEKDFHNFIKLMQKKSELDAVYGIKPISSVETSGTTNLNEIQPSDEQKVGAAKILPPAKYDEARAFGIEGSQAAEDKFIKDQKAVEGQNQKLSPTKKPSFWAKLKQDFSPMKYQEGPVREAWLDRTKDILVGNEKANKAFQELESLPKGFSSMIKYQRGEMGQDWDYAQRVKSLFDKLYQEGQDRGLKIGYQEHYLPQVYANPSGDIIQAVAKYMADNGVDGEVIKDYLSGKALPEEMSKTLKLNPSFSRDKAFPDYGVAMDYGLTPRFEHPGQLAGYYVTEMEKTLANKKYLDTLQDIGALSGTRRDGDKVLDIPYFAQDLYGKPRLVNALQAYFRDEENVGTMEHIARGAATINRRLQELALSGGVPGTNINFFTIGAGVIKDTTAGELKVFGRFLRSNFEKATLDYFRTNQKYIDMMAEERINLGSRTGNWDRIYRQLSTKTGFARATEWFGEKFDWAFNKKTFQSFMPMQTVDIFKRTFDSAIKQGLQEIEARKLAADTTKAWMGLTEDWGRGRTLQDTINALFFAPRFRESLINLFVNTGRSITPKKFGGAFGNKAFKTNRKFFVGAILSFVLYNLLNKQLNGNYMWQNESGKEFDLKIPYGNNKFVYLAFLPSVLAFPRNMASGAIALGKGDFGTATEKFGSLFSMLIKATTEVISNQDYFGRPIYKDTDTVPVKLGKIAAYLGLNYNHPYVQSVYELATQGGNKDLFQTLSRAFELPFKFSSQEAINRSTFYNVTNALKTPHARDIERIQPIYLKVQQLVQDGKKDEAQSIVDDLSDADYEIYKGIRSAAKAKATAQAEAQMVNTVNEVRDLIANGENDKAQAIVDDMSDEEYRIYNLAKKKMGL